MHFSSCILDGLNEDVGQGHTVTNPHTRMTRMTRANRTFELSRLTACMASTAMLEKNSHSEPIIFELIEVLAELTRISRPRSSVGMIMWS